MLEKNLKWRIGGTLGAAFFFVSVAAHGDSAPVRVGFDDAVRRAMTRNPTAEVALQEVRRAEALVVQARSGWLPTLTANATYTRLDADRVLADRVIQGANSLSANLQLTVPIIAPKAWVLHARAKDNVDLNKLSAVDTQRQVAVATGKAFLTVVGQHRVLETAERARDTAKAHEEFAKTRLSGGVGNNADATPTELAARSQVQIWHNTANVFQDLDIGTNNLISHAGATDNAFHGWELQLANAVAASRFTQAQVYLVKCGQGGSRIVEWSVGHGSGYWSTALSRIQAAKTAMSAAGKAPVPIVFFSLGINDAIGNSTYGTVAPPTSDWPAWRTDVEGLISRLRTELGATTPVLMTKFEAPLTVRANVNTQLDAIDAADAYAVAVSSSGAPSQGDGNHWTYAGYKLMTERMIDGGLALLGNAAATAPGVTPASGTYAGAQTVTITAPSALRTLYTDDGSDPLIGTVYSAPFSETPPKTVKAVAIETGKPSSTQVQRDYAASGGGGTTWNPSAAGTYISLLTSNTVASSTTTSTFTSVRGTSGKSSGKYYFEVVADTAPDSNDVIVGIQTAETAGGSGMDNFNPTSTYVHRYDGGFASGIFTSLGYGGYGSLTAGDVIQVAVDATAGKVWIGRNNTFWTGDPAAGTGGAATWTPGPVIYPAVAIYNTAARLRLVPSSTTYTPPSGFTVWG